MGATSEVPRGGALGAPGVAPALPDSRGTNLFRADPGFAALLTLYLEPALHAHLAPHLDRLGALAGDSLDELAGVADRNPPRLHHRDRGTFRLVVIDIGAPLETQSQRASHSTSQGLISAETSAQ